MSARDPQPSPERIRIGADGFAMLALSTALMLLTSGVTLLASLAYVVWVACRTRCDAPLGSPCVLVLGMRLTARGEPGPEYRARLMRAVTLYARGGMGPIVILGGTTAAGQPSEAAAGAVFLQAHRIPAAAIRLEDRSRHTLENLLLYRADFAAAAGPAVLVTSRFHLARSSLLATGLAIRHAPCAAEQTRWPLLRQLPLLVFEAVLIHWYITGRCFALLTGNRRMAARIS